LVVVAFDLCVVVFFFSPQMPKVVVFGGGSFGTALAYVLSKVWLL
jgi:hypothetical protein